MPVIPQFTFESNIEPWLADGYEFPGNENTEIVRSSARSRTGSYSMKVTTKGDGVLQSKTRTPEIFYSEPNVIAMSDMIGKKRGWEFWAYSSNPNLSGWSGEWVFWKNINEVAGGRTISWVPNEFGEWNRVHVMPEIIPPDSNYLVIKVTGYLEETMVGTEYYLDDFGILTEDGRVPTRKRQLHSELFTVRRGPQSMSSARKRQHDI